MPGKTSVFGIFPSRTQAENCVDAFKAQGFRANDISVLMASPESTRELSTEKNTKAPEGATSGAIAVGAVGGALGLLAGIGALAIPGVGPMIAAGPIMSALAGIGVGATAGGIVGALVGMGVPEYEAKRFQGRVKEGGVLISVHCDNGDWEKKARDLLKQHGAEDIATSGEASVSSIKQAS